MIEARVTIQNELGLHLRAAARVVARTSQSSCSVMLSARGNTVDGKSLLGITSLLASRGTELTIQADGDGDNALVADLVNLIESGFKR